MAKNDVILLDGIIQEIMATELLDKGNAFELFSLQQILKSYDLTRDEIDFGWTDGKDDGGIDGFYVFLNGVLLQATEKYIWPKKDVSIEIWVISCKHRDSFKQAPLNSIFPTVEELFDFNKTPSEFKGKYSDKLLEIRKTAFEAYSKTASAIPVLHFYFAYASRGDVNELGDNIEARGNQLVRFVNDYFSGSSTSIKYYGSAELIELHRKNRIILQIPYVEELCKEQGAYVLLVRIDILAQVVSDDHGQLRRYLFDSNVRDFLGKTRVNIDIMESLQNNQSPDFWWLNNGITMLATSAAYLGKKQLGNTIQLHDVQIVNGLQTTQSIFSHVPPAKPGA